MRVLHVASITENPFNGVCVAVPQHVCHQGEFAETALLNITNKTINGVPAQLKYGDKLSLMDMCKPFGKPDIIVFHEAYRAPYLKLSRMARKSDIPYVIVPHGELSEFAQKKKRIKKIVANCLLFNRFIEGSSAIQCLSKSELEGTHFKCRKFIGTNGVELPHEHKMSFSAGSVKFLYIGRLEVHIKGLDLMLEAFSNQAALMRQTGSSLTIYGPDLYGRFEQVKNLISEYGIEDFVSLNHEILGIDKTKALLDSDIFIQTSRTEGMPMGILEAMSYGLPCVITDGTSLTEDLDKYGAGWACDNTATSISDAIRSVLSNTINLSDMGVAARRLVCSEYCWSTICSDTIEHYKSFTFQAITHQNGRRPR